MRAFRRAAAALPVLSRRSRSRRRVRSAESAPSGSRLGLRGGAAPRSSFPTFAGLRSPSARALAGTFLLLIGALAAPRPAEAQSVCLDKDAVDNLLLKEGGSATMTVTLGSAYHEDTVIELETLTKAQKPFLYTAESTDVSLSPTRLSFPQGTTSVSATLEAKLDPDHDDETLRVRIDSTKLPEGTYTCSGNRYFRDVMILDYSLPAPSLSLTASTTNPSELETFTLTATLSRAVNIATSFNLKFSAEDLLTESGDEFAMTIAAGKTSATRSFTPKLDDDIFNTSFTVKAADAPSWLAISNAVEGMLVLDIDRPTLNLSGSAKQVNEGEQWSYTIKASRPFPGNGNIAVNWCVSGTCGEGAYPPFQFPQGQEDYKIGVRKGETSSTVTVTVVHDDDTADETVTVSIAPKELLGYYKGGASSSITLTVVDDDDPTVLVSETELTIDENGTATYTVRLAAKPSGDVTVTPSSEDPSVATVSPGSLTFGPTNWNTPQEVTVTGL